MKFCVGFLKYACVNYENTPEEDLICLCLLFFSLVTKDWGFYLQIVLKMSSGMTWLVHSQFNGGIFLGRRR